MIIDWPLRFNEQHIHATSAVLFMKKIILQHKDITMERKATKVSWICLESTLSFLKREVSKMYVVLQRICWVRYYIQKVNERIEWKVLIKNRTCMLFVRNWGKSEYYACSFHFEISTFNRHHPHFLFFLRFLISVAFSHSLTFPVSFLSVYFRLSSHISQVHYFPSVNLWLVQKTILLFIFSEDFLEILKIYSQKLGKQKGKSMRGERFGRGNGVLRVFWVHWGSRG